MTGLVPIIDGQIEGALRFTLEQAAERIADAHREGKRWSCRIKTSGQRYRVLTKEETATLVAAVTEQLREEHP